MLEIRRADGAGLGDQFLKMLRQRDVHGYTIGLDSIYCQNPHI